MYLIIIINYHQNKLQISSKSTAFPSVLSIDFLYLYFYKEKKEQGLEVQLLMLHLLQV